MRELRQAKKFLKVTEAGQGGYEADMVAFAVILHLQQIVRREGTESPADLRMTRERKYVLNVELKLVNLA